MNQTPGQVVSNPSLACRGDGMGDQPIEPKAMPKLASHMAAPSCGTLVNQAVVGNERKLLLLLQ
jgi:hypothetical protein